VDVPVERREPLLPVAVHVVGELEARLTRGLEERAEQRVGGRAAFEHEWAGGASELVVRLGREAALHPAEVGEAVRVVPRLHPGVGAPALIVQGVAALEDHPVDAARAPEDLASSVVDPAAVHVRFRFGLVLPVVEPVADRERERRRHVDVDVPRVVGPSGLEHEDAVGWVGRQAVGERAPRRPPTDDHEVERSRRHRPS
jgi:hypothetical protein